MLDKNTYGSFNLTCICEEKENLVLVMMLLLDKNTYGLFN